MPHSDMSSGDYKRLFLRNGSLNSAQSAEYPHYNPGFVQKDGAGPGTHWEQRSLACWGWPHASSCGAGIQVGVGSPVPTSGASSDT